MRRYMVKQIIDENHVYYIIVEAESYNYHLLSSKYLLYLDECRKSSNTVKQAAYSVAYYLNYMDSVGTSATKVTELSYSEQQMHFQKFLRWLSEGSHTDSSRKTSHTTCNIYLTAVFRWYDFLVRNEYTQPLKVVDECTYYSHNTVGVSTRRSGLGYQGYFRTEEPTVKAVTRETIQRYIESASNLRDRLLLIFMAETGARIGELLGIHYTEDIDFEKHRIKVKYRADNENQSKAKNEENRWLDVSPDAFGMLVSYMAKYQDVLKDTNYLFIVLSGETQGVPMDVNAVYAMLKRLEEKTGIHVTPHQFRRYFANERRAAGWPIETISKAMGHRNIRTTMRYFTFDEDEQKKANEIYFASVGSLCDISALL